MQSRKKQATVARLAEPRMRGKPTDLFRDHFQCPRTAAELVGFDTEVLEHRDKQVTQGLIVIPVQGKVLTMSPATTTEQDWKVRVVMRVGVTHVASKQDHRAV